MCVTECPFSNRAPRAILPSTSRCARGSRPVDCAGNQTRVQGANAGFDAVALRWTGQQELVMTTSSRPKDHFFPRVHATARLVKEARRAKRLGVPRLMRRMGLTAGISRLPRVAEWVRRIETGCFPFPGRQTTMALSEVLRIDPTALFAAQCADFEELDRREPYFVYGRQHHISHAGASTYQPSPVPMSREMSDAEAREWARERFDYLVGRPCTSHLTQAWACILWSSIRCEWLLASGKSVRGFRPPILVPMTTEESWWYDNWCAGLESWLGVQSVGEAQ